MITKWDPDYRDLQKLVEKWMQEATVRAGGSGH